MKYPYHIAFVAPEVTPNLTPAIDSRLKPQKIFLLYPAELKKQMKKLIQFYQAYGIKTQAIEIKSAYNIEQVKRGLEKVVERIQKENLKDLAINLSCGPKMMTIAAIQYFANTPAHLFYLKPNDQLIWLNQEHPSINLQDKLTLENLLQTKDMSYQALCWSEQQHTKAQIALKLLKSHILPQNLVHTLNLEIKSWQGVAAKQEKPMPQYQAFRQQLSQKFPQFKFKKDRLKEGYDKFVLKLLQGGWLEYYVYQTLKTLQLEIPQIQDVQMGCVIRSEEKIKDEIDVMLLLNNKLYIIECKTGKNTDTNLHLQRLDSLSRKLGGGLSNKALITTTYLPEYGGAYAKAQQLGVQIFNQQHLNQLKKHLKKWLEETL